MFQNTMDMTCFQNSIYRIASTRARSSREGKPFHSLQLITCIKGLNFSRAFHFQTTFFFTKAIAAGVAGAHTAREVMFPWTEL